MLTPEREKEIREFVNQDAGRFALFTETLKELLDEIDVLRESTTPHSDMSRCQIIIEMNDLTLGIGKGYAKGICELKDGTLVNLGVKINISSKDGTETRTE